MRYMVSVEYDSDLVGGSAGVGYLPSAPDLCS